MKPQKKKAMTATANALARKKKRSGRRAFSLVLAGGLGMRMEPV